MQVITLDEKNLDQLSRDLFYKIEASSWLPDLVVGIKTGGIYVSQPLYDELSLKYSSLYNTISLSRPSTAKKKKFKIGKILKLFPYLILDILRNIEVYFFEATKANTYSSNREENIIINKKLLEQILSVKKILLVDDAIDTGSTVLAIKNKFLSLNNNLEIKIAVLTTTHKNSYIKADFSLYERILLRCSWAEDYKATKDD